MNKLTKVMTLILLLSSSNAMASWCETVDNQERYWMSMIGKLSAMNAPKSTIDYAFSRLKHWQNQQISCTEGGSSTIGS